MRLRPRRKRRANAVRQRPRKPRKHRPASLRDPNARLRHAVERLHYAGQTRAWEVVRGFRHKLGVLAVPLRAGDGGRVARSVARPQGAGDNRRHRHAANPPHGQKLGVAFRGRRGGYNRRKIRRLHRLCFRDERRGLRRPHLPDFGPAHPPPPATPTATSGRTPT